LVGEEPRDYHNNRDDDIIIYGFDGNCS